MFYDSKSILDNFENQELRINFPSSLISLFFWSSFKNMRESRSKMAWREEVNSRKVLPLIKTYFDPICVVVNFFFSCIRWLYNDITVKFEFQSCWESAIWSLFILGKRVRNLTVNDSKSQIANGKAVANLQSGFRMLKYLCIFSIHSFPLSSKWDK